MAKNFSENLGKKYVCDFCDFNSKNKCDYNKHCLTIKHKRLKNAKNANKISENLGNEEFVCICGKVYKHQSSLSKHKKKCCCIENEEQIVECEDNKEGLKSLIIKIMTDNGEKMNFLMKENQELRNQITELIPKVGNNNNNKNKFNINVFLNEKCRDAISIDEFIDKIEVSMKNLLTTRDRGLSEGLSNIIIDNMNKLSVYERPLHCTDKKRETLYIKQDDWVKDDNREKINEVLKKVSNKQFKTINKWIHENPNYNNDESLKDEYIQLVTKCTESLDENERKLIKNICNNVYLENK